jgi:phage portal protein BeeE
VAGRGKSKPKGKVTRKRAKAVTVNTAGGINMPWLNTTITAADTTGRMWAERRTHQELMSFFGHWVSICARKNASVCASQKLRLYSQDTSKKGRKVKRREIERIKEMGGDAANMARFGAIEIEDHPILDLLNKPSKYYTAADTTYLRFISKEIVGDSYTLIDDEGADMAMIPLLPQYVSAKIGKSGDEQYLEGYLYGRDMAIAKLYPRESIYHTKFAPDPTDPYSGRSPVSDIFPYAQLLTLATMSEQARWKNFGLPPVHVDFDPNTSKDQIDQYVESVKRQVAGVANSGNWLVTRGAKITPMAMKPRDMEYTAGTVECAKIIWAAYDIPESVVRPNEGSLAAAAAGDPAWMRYGILPRLQRDADDLTNLLIPMFEGMEMEGYFFAYDNPVAEDEEKKVQTLIQLKMAGAISVNELREELGREPMEEVALSTEVADAATETAEEPEEADTPEPEPEPEEENEEPEAKTKHVCFYDSPCGCCHSDTRVKEVDKLASLEAALKSAIDGWLKRVADMAAVGVTEVPSLMQAELQGILQRYFAEGYRDAMSGEVMSPQAVTEMSNVYAGERTRLIIEELTNTTNDKLAAIIQRTTETGNARQAVQDIMGPGVNEDRAAVIARTEVSNIQGSVANAQIEAAGQNRKWDVLASACPICLALVDKIVATYGSNSVPPGVPFMRGGESLTYVDEGGKVRTFTAKWDINHNPAHPNCACDVIGVNPDAN